MATQCSTRLREIDRPLERLHAADGAANDQLYAGDSQEPEQLVLRAHHVADGDQGKAGAVLFAGLRIDGARGRWSRNRSRGCCCRCTQ